MRLIPKPHLYSFKLFPFLDRVWKLLFYPFSLDPITPHPLSTPSHYYQLHQTATLCSYPDVDVLEASASFNIDRDWFNNLALATQTVIKTSNLSFAHGRVLYTLLCQYIHSLHSQGILSPLTVFETGTARGFSSLCMAKALSDMSFCGRIHTCDVLPHNLPIYWNSISDHTIGRQTRSQLLSEWKELVSSTITFHQCTSVTFFSSVHTERIHFAFLDAVHTFSAVMSEFRAIQERQLKNDIVVFDDYDAKLFPGVVKAVNLISKTYPYNIDFISTGHSRFLAVATRI